MQVAEARIGRLSSSQRDFIIIQSEKNSLIELGRKRKRSNEEDTMLNCSGEFKSSCFTARGTWRL